MEEKKYMQCHLKYVENNSCVTSLIYSVHEKYMHL